MSEQKSKRCIVLLPSGDPHYDRLFDELFAFAIADAGLIPLRIQQNLTSPLPLDLLVDEITQADTVFADLSRNDIDIWFGIGCAITLGKPLCLVSSDLNSSLPFDVQNLKILSYPAVPLPSDYAELEQSITAHLSARLPKMTIVQPARMQQAPLAPPSSFITDPTITDTTVLSDDLTAHEILALTIIDKGSEHGLSPRELGLEMKESESAHLTSHAMSSLKRRKFIEKRPIQMREGNESYISENLFVTDSGESWLLRHGRRKPLQPVPGPRELFLSSR